MAFVSTMCFVDFSIVETECIHSAGCVSFLFDVKNKDVRVFNSNTSVNFKIQHLIDVFLIKGGFALWEECWQSFGRSPSY